MRNEATMKVTKNAAGAVDSTMLALSCDRLASILRQHEQLGELVVQQQALLSATRRMVRSNARA